MLIGKLDQIVTLYSYAVTNNEGEATEAYTLVGDAWAQVKTETGNEAFEAARKNANRTIRVKMRYRTDVTTRWRLVWEGETYYITAVDRSNRRQGELWVTAKITEAL